MRSFDAADLLRIWERGRDLHAIDQALLLLSATYPDIGSDELAALTVGQRDSHLLSIYERNFGPQLAGTAACPQCRERLEFACFVSDITLPASNQAGDLLFSLETAGHDIQFRLPNSRHLATVLNGTQGRQEEELGGRVAGARMQLLEQCVVTANHEGAQVSIGELPADVCAAINAAMASADPQADVQLQFACPACEHAWTAPFDIVPFLWTKIAGRARRLLYEIHLLAGAYHWSETEILALTSTRRRTYLELVTQ